MTKNLKLRPKKSYGKTIKNNPNLLKDLCQRHANGESYATIAYSLGISYQHCMKLIKEARTDNI